MEDDQLPVWLLTGPEDLCLNMLRLGRSKRKTVVGG